MSASDLTRLFNAYAPGEMVTIAGVRKWMVGQSIPRPSRMDVLAEIVGVSPAWLRYGEGASEAVVSDFMCPSREEQIWWTELSCLSPSAIVLVTEFVKILLTMQLASDES